MGPRAPGFDTDAEWAAYDKRIAFTTPVHGGKQLFTIAQWGPDCLGQSGTGVGTYFRKLSDGTIVDAQKWKAEPGRDRPDRVP